MTTVMDWNPLKTQDVFFFFTLSKKNKRKHLWESHAVRRSPTKPENNNEMKVCQWDKRQEGVGLGEENKEQSFMLIHILSRKNETHCSHMSISHNEPLISRSWRNSERGRWRSLCAVFLFSVWQEASSQQALRDLLLSLSTDSIRISVEMAEIDARRSWPVRMLRTPGFGGEEPIQWGGGISSNLWERSVPESL